MQNAAVGMGANRFAWDQPLTSDNILRIKAQWIPGTIVVTPRISLLVFKEWEGFGSLQNPSMDPPGICVVFKECEGYKTRSLDPLGKSMFMPTRYVDVAPRRWAGLCATELARYVVSGKDEPLEALLGRVCVCVE